MKTLQSKLLLLSLLFLLACNADRQELVIQDLKNNNIDTSSLGNNDTNNNSNNNNSNTGALGSQKIAVTVVIDPSFPKNVTRVRVRAFTSRTPIVVSTWVDLTKSNTPGTFTGTYDAAPNPPTKFGMHAQAYNGNTLVGEAAGSETEYTNNGDGSTIIGNTMTINTAL